MSARSFLRYPKNIPTYPILMLRMPWGTMGGMETTEAKRRAFRDNLRDWVGNRPVGVVARSLGIQYKRLHRWLTEGIERPDHRSFPAILKLAEAIGLSDWSRLWEKGLFRPSSPGLLDEARRLCSEKIRDLYRDDAWLPSLIEVIDRLWEQRDRSLAGSSSPEGAEWEPGHGKEHKAEQATYEGPLSN